MTAVSMEVGSSSNTGKFLTVVKAISLPVLLATVPPLYFYGNNARIVPFSSLGRTVLLYGGLSVIIYLIFLTFQRLRPFRAANAAFIFMIFFHTYGVLFNALLKADVIPVENYTLFPLVLLTAIYAAWYGSRIKPKVFWKSAMFITGALVVMNVIKIVPVELGKYTASIDQKYEASQVKVSGVGNTHPDIYYFLFDEFASLSTMRDYWNYQGVDEFAEFLTSKGFYVAENSSGNSIDTLHLTSERLNYETLDLQTETFDTFSEAISKNKAMAYLKDKGYSTVLFSEINFGYPTMPPIDADYSFLYGSIGEANKRVDTGLLFDDYGMLVAQNTMLQMLNLPSKNTIDSIFLQHQEMIYFTRDKVSNLSEIPSPKFVYVHLLLPHYPFMFRENGSLNRPEDFYDWKSYLENYKFTMRYATGIVKDLLDKSDPQHPPVIILQSDHGPRNIVVEYRGGVPLDNFPEEYKTRILNALYLPGCNSPDLSQDMNPIDTFPIIFNCYFQTDIPMQ